jgi:CBS domain-containing protein
MKKPFYVNEDTGLLRAFAFFHEHNVYDIPVVDKAGNLVGIASYVDVGVALMKNWKLSD